MSEVATRAKFDYIRYSQCWEDPELHRQALRIAPGDHVLAIASAGDNSFAHLLDDPERVIAVDLNPTQIALCELKKGALRHLDYPDLLAFLGVRPCRDRWRLYRQLRDQLPSLARDFFDGQREVIDAGVLHVGKLERYFGHFRTKVLPLVHSRDFVAEMCSCFSLDEQRALFHTRWNNRRWRWILGVFFSRFAMGRLGRDRAFFRYVTIPDVGKHFLGRAEFAFTRFLIADNPYMSYMLQGNFRNHHALPPYLREENLATLRERLDRLEFRLGSVEDVLASCGANAIHKANFSDIFEYMSETSGEALLRQLLRVSAPSLRIAYWNLLVTRNAPASLVDQLQYDADLSAQLSAQDRSFLYYRFVVEHAPTA